MSKIHFIGTVHFQLSCKSAFSCFKFSHSAFWRMHCVVTATQTEDVRHFRIPNLQLHMKDSVEKVIYLFIYLFRERENIKTFFSKTWASNPGFCFFFFFSEKIDIVQGGRNATPYILKCFSLIYLSTGSLWQNSSWPDHSPKLPESFLVSHSHQRVKTLLQQRKRRLQVNPGCASVSYYCMGGSSGPRR